MKLTVKLLREILQAGGFLYSAGEGETDARGRELREAGSRVQQWAAQELAKREAADV
jgi:hypothetical protein